MSTLAFPAGAALAEPAVVDDEFSLDVRLVLAHGNPTMGDCPTDDGCGQTCAGDASACVSYTDDPS